MLPKIVTSRSNTENCISPRSVLDHCESLLQSNAYRIMLWIYASFSLVGNAMSFIGRIIFSGKSQSGFGIFVSSLCISDLTMGVYLTQIGVADAIYGEDYVIHTDKWKTSVMCHMSGFFSLLSNEVSAYSICLITIDRFLVLRFPFSRYHFSRSSAAIASVLSWCVGTTIAAVPLLPSLSQWHSFSQSSVCVPLPFSNTFAGYTYSLAVMIIVNLVLFVFIAAGQIIIYQSVMANTLGEGAQRDAGARDAVIARR